jgi:hypothetical protein
MPRARPDILTAPVHSQALQRIGDDLQEIGHLESRDYLAE